MELSRAVRDTSDNPLLTIIQNVFGPVLLVLQQNFNDALDGLSNLVEQVRSAEIYTLISFLLSTVGVTLDNVTSIIAEVQADVNTVFAIFTGTDLS